MKQVRRYFDIWPFPIFLVIAVTFSALRSGNWVRYNNLFKVVTFRSNHTIVSYSERGCLARIAKLSHCYSCEKLSLYTLYTNCSTLWQYTVLFLTGLIPKLHWNTLGFLYNICCVILRLYVSTLIPLPSSENRNININI